MIKKDIGEICIEGASAYRKARQYMERLIPAQLNLLNEHKGHQPIFAHYGVEDMLEHMHQPTVQLKSGGYIVINPTEALVAIDVNSGKSTSAHHIEDTALKTNLEAAEEIARQVRLRDLAGLMVVDFIDMEQNENVREVERKMRDAARSDRAKVQIGRISPNFGLLEMSRQRLRSDLSEGRIEPCAACDGSGQVPTAQAIALRALRAGVAAATKSGAKCETVLRLEWPVALYILNHKRDELSHIEQTRGIRLKIEIGAMDDPNQPWLLETRKMSGGETASAPNGAVSMETAYTQMTPPTAADIKEAKSAEPRKRHNRQKQRRQKQRHHQPGQQQGQVQHASRHRSKRSERGGKKAQAQKSSLWQRFFGANQ